MCRGLPLPVELQEILSSCPSSIHLWPAKSNWILSMKHLFLQFPSILAIYCFYLLQNPSSGYPQPLDDSPDGLDIVQLEQLAYWATLSRQPKDNQGIYKRFLCQYSRTQEPTHAVKTGFPPVHRLLRLATRLTNGRMKRFLQHDSGAVASDFTKKDHAATWGRPFFLFRPRNGRNTEDNTQ